MTALPIDPAEQDAEASSMVSTDEQINTARESGVEVGEPPDIVPPVGEEESSPVLGTILVKNANERGDQGGTVYLKELEPFCPGIRTLPMYSLLEATVRLPNKDGFVVLHGYINRRSGMTSYWGDRLKRNGQKWRVIWDEAALCPLPGKSQSISLEVLAFTHHANAATRSAANTTASA